MMSLDESVEMQEISLEMPSSSSATATTLKRKLTEDGTVDEDFPEYFSLEVSSSPVKNTSNVLVNVVTVQKKKRKRAKKSNKNEPANDIQIVAGALEKSLVEVYESPCLSPSTTFLSSSVLSSSSSIAASDLQPLNQPSTDKIITNPVPKHSKKITANPITEVKVRNNTETSALREHEESHMIRLSTSVASVKQNVLNPLEENDVATAYIPPSTSQDIVVVQPIRKTQSQLKYRYLIILIQYITLLTCLLGGAILILPQQLSNHLDVFHVPVSNMVMKSLFYGGLKWTITSVSAFSGEHVYNSTEPDIEFINQEKAVVASETNSATSDTISEVSSDEIVGEVEVEVEAVGAVDGAEFHTVAVDYENKIESDTAGSTTESQDSVGVDTIQQSDDIGEDLEEKTLVEESRAIDSSSDSVSVPFAVDDESHDSVSDESDIRSDAVVDDIVSSGVKEADGPISPPHPGDESVETDPASDVQSIDSTIPVQVDSSTAADNESSESSDANNVDSSVQFISDEPSIPEVVDSADNELLAAVDVSVVVDYSAVDTAEDDDKNVGATLDGVADEGSAVESTVDGDVGTSVEDPAAVSATEGSVAADDSADKSDDSTTDAIDVADAVAGGSVENSVDDTTTSDGEGDSSPAEEISPSSVVTDDSLDRVILDYAVFPRGGQILKPNSKAFDGSVLTSAPYKGPTLLLQNNTSQSSNIIGLVKNIVFQKNKQADRSVLISSNPLEYGSCYYLSMVEGRNVTVSMHSAIIPTKIVLQHIISADTDENGRTCAPREVRVTGWSKDPRSGLFDGKRKTAGILAVDLGEHHARFDNLSWAAVEGSLVMTTKEEFSLPKLLTPVKTVTLTILSNHGHDRFVCLYRIQVYGFLSQG